MTPPTDSLELALRAVPLLANDVECPECLSDHSVPDYPALAMAVRAWIRANMPEPSTPGITYNVALADVA